MTPRTSQPVSETVARLRATVADGRTRSAGWRRAQLAGLARLLAEREDDLARALYSDLRKSPIEAWTTEIGFTAAEAALARRRLRRWMRSRRVPTPLALQPGACRIVPEPLGVALIIAPWNYPLQLVLSPLVGALAAGDCAVVKPSELAPNTAEVLADLLPLYLDPEAVAVVPGGVPETTALLEQRWDKIFYTGNGRVGRIVMAAAARHLTPVTLELGGKSPCIVDADADLAVAARRIAWGKFLNAGQTCVAPDYVLVHRGQEQALIEALAAAIRAMFGDQPRGSPDYARIVNNRHFDRLAGLIAGGEVAIGGDADPTDRYIAPTVLRRVAADAPVMQEEIFGPILPILAVDGLDDAIAVVNRGDKPLALYLFSRSAGSKRRVLAETSSGGVAINDVVLQFAAPGLPFGGVGASGMGAYHGEHGFRAFSHMKAVLRKPTAFDVALRYPPYSAAKLRWLRRFI
jgi:aldehyde dehydrogenase (NAD+)